jgi:carbamoyltransferase
LLRKRAKLYNKKEVQMLALGCHGYPTQWEMEDSSGTAGHDTAAVLICDGKVIAAIEEERLNRVKHTSCFPARAIDFCLRQAGARLEDIDAITLDYTEDLADLHLATEVLVLPTAPRRSARHMVADAFRREFDVDVSNKLRFCRHHLAHLYGVWYLSGFTDALVLCIDGTGDGLSGIVAHCQSSKITVLRHLSPLHSLGNFYDRAILVLGYGNFEEYKAMGLAPYGDPTVFEQLFTRQYCLLPEGRFSLMPLNEAFTLMQEAGLVGRARRKGEPFTQEHKDFVAALQVALERIVTHVVMHFQQLTQARNLCLSGGVAHNCSMNGRLLQTKAFQRIYVAPAAHDGGNALGSALSVLHGTASLAHRNEIFPHVFFGPDVGSRDSIGRRITQWVPLLSASMVADAPTTAAHLIAEGAVIGWVQGRSEFGPRALGNRSILADPRPSRNKDIINAMVKKREGFRPFAPAVLEERLHEFFELPGDAASAAHMSFALSVRPQMRELLGAVTHVDGTARVQCVIRRYNERFHTLIEEFGRITGVPVVLNTSFNNDNEPIVDSVDDAVTCFLTTDIQYLVIGDWVAHKPASIREHRGLVDLVPTIPQSYKLVRRTESTGSEARFSLERAPSADYATPVPVSRNLALILALREPAESVRATCTRLRSSLDSIEDLGQELFAVWQKRALRLLPADNRP